MKTKRVLVLTFAFLLVFGLIGAALPPEIEKSLHEVKLLKINNERKTHKIWDLRSNPQMADIIDISFLDRNLLETQQLEILKNWVKSGNTLICRPHNSRMLREFGISTGEFKGYDVHGRTNVEPASNHPVLTNVKRVKLFLNNPLESGYDVALLKWKDFTVAGLKYYGNGLIAAMFYSNIAQERQKLDNERLLVNLREYFAGYPIPGRPYQGQDRLVLKFDRTLNGEVQTNWFKLQTPYAGTIGFSQEEIASISLKAQDTIRLKRGDKLIGKLLTASVEIRTDAGWKNINTENIELISFN